MRESTLEAAQPGGSLRRGRGRVWRRAHGSAGRELAGGIGRA
jgi:hypothetical protein